MAFLSAFYASSYFFLCSLSNFLFWLLLLLICDLCNCSFIGIFVSLQVVFESLFLVFCPFISICLEVDFFLCIMFGIHQDLESENWCLSTILENFWPIFSSNFIFHIFYLELYLKYVRYSCSALHAS